LSRSHLSFDVITIFPEMFVSVVAASLLKKAQNKNLLSIHLHDLRNFSDNKHNQVDDAPYGGGVGMVLKPEPAVKALESVTQQENKEENKKVRRIFFSPQGQPLTSKRARELASYDQLVLLCGRYEGVDERVMEFVDEEISIGDYILSGGELAALVFIDVVARFIPGVVGDARSVTEDSFEDGGLKFPQYTRPESFRGLKVPAPLLTGHHEDIEKWRRLQSLARTARKRPDLLASLDLTPEEWDYIKSLASLKDIC
jgi:tRNA (guanine37-N1)-methyltransferase